MSTLFTKIIEGEIPGTFVHQDDVCVAFMDVMPLTTGHVMVVPRVEVDHWLDLDQETLDHLMRVAKRIGAAQQTAFEPQRIGMMIQGFEVPHVHVHVWPVNGIADFDIAGRSPMLTAEDLAGPAEKIRQALRD